MDADNSSTTNNKKSSLMDRYTVEIITHNHRINKIIDAWSMKIENGRVNFFYPNPKTGYHEIFQSYPADCTLIHNIQYNAPRIEKASE